MSAKNSGNRPSGSSPDGSGGGLDPSLAAGPVDRRPPAAGSDPARPFPDVATLPARYVLGNGRYGVLLAEDGTGFSWFERWGLTGWSRDRAAGLSGFHLYLHDLESGRAWSAGRRPVRIPADRYEVCRDPGRVTIERRDGNLEAVVDVCVHPGAPLELRRLRLRNLGIAPRRLQVTTYGEVALHDPPAHEGHPAFSRLFVRSEHEPACGALLFRRRPRGEGESFPWLVHAVAGTHPPREWETDRARFLGRGRDASAPRVLCGSTPLSCTTGDVLDPVLALRLDVSLAPGEEAERVLLLGAGASRAEALELLSAALDGEAVAGIFSEAARRDEARWERLGLSPRTARAFETLGAAILYGEPAVRPGAELLRRISGLRAAPARPSLAPRRAFVAAPPATVAARMELTAAAGYWEELGLPIDVVLCAADGALSILHAAGSDAPAREAGPRGARP